MIVEDIVKNSTESPITEAQLRWPESICRQSCDENMSVNVVVVAITREDGVVDQLPELIHRHLCHTPKICNLILMMISILYPLFSTLYFFIVLLQICLAILFLSM